MAKSRLAYGDAVKELEKILSELENSEEINMDVISDKVKRAAQLIDVCKKQLHEIDVELEKLLESLD